MSVPRFQHDIFNPENGASGSADRPVVSPYEAAPTPMVMVSTMPTTMAMPPHLPSAPAPEWNRFQPPPQQMMPQPHPSGFLEFPQYPLHQRPEFGHGQAPTMPAVYQTSYSNQSGTRPPFPSEIQLGMRRPNPSEIRHLWHDVRPEALQEQPPNPPGVHYLHPDPHTVSTSTPDGRVVEPLRVVQVWPGQTTTPVSISSDSTLSTAPIPSIGSSFLERDMSVGYGANGAANGQNDATQDDEEEGGGFNTIIVTPFKQGSVEEDSAPAESPQPTPRRGRGRPAASTDLVAIMPHPGSIPNRVVPRRQNPGRRGGRGGHHSSMPLPKTARASESTSPTFRKANPRWTQEETDALSQAYRRCILEYFTEDRFIELCPRRTAGASRQQMRKMKLPLPL